MKLCQHCQKPFELKSIRHPKQRYCSQRCIRDVWVIKNPVANLKSKQKYLDSNKVKRAESSSAYMKRNRPYYAQYSSLRNRKVQQAKPRWVDEDALLKIYKQASELSLEVDHIIPITNKAVCGLHVPWNLQLLTRSENARKSNKFDEDVICKLIKETVDV